MRKIIIFILFVAVLGLAGASIYLGTQVEDTSAPDDIAATSCVSPGGPYKSAGALCNQQCGDLACDEGGPLGCNYCDSDTIAEGEYRCTFNPNDFRNEYEAHCGGNRTAENVCNSGDVEDRGSCGELGCAANQVPVRTCNANGNGWDLGCARRDACNAPNPCDNANNRPNGCACNNAAQCESFTCNGTCQPNNANGKQLGDECDPGAVASCGSTGLQCWQCLNDYVYAGEGRCVDPTAADRNAVLRDSCGGVTSVGTGGTCSAGRQLVCYWCPNKLDMSGGCQGPATQPDGGATLNLNTGNDARIINESLVAQYETNVNSCGLVQCDCALGEGETAADRIFLSQIFTAGCSENGVEPPIIIEPENITCYRCTERTDDGNICESETRLETEGCRAGWTTNSNCSQEAGGQCPVIEENNITCYRCTERTDDGNICESETRLETEGCRTGWTTNSNCSQEAGGQCPVTEDQNFCQNLTANPAGEITLGAGNIVTYTLNYINNSTTNPFPNIGLIVEGNRGRDANRTAQTIVIPNSTPTFNAAANRWTYTFRWEAADATANLQTQLTAGTYEVTVLRDISNSSSIISEQACQAEVTITTDVTTPVCGDGLCNVVGELCEFGPGNTQFRCSDNTAITGCRAPGSAQECTFCGDGVVQPGEQCDPNDPVTGNNCNAQCEIIQVTEQCINLAKQPVGEIAVGEGNRVVFTLNYRVASATNPFPNIGLFVQDTAGSAVGRDSDRLNQSFVRPANIANNPFYNPTNNTWSYTFIWEAADSTSGNGTPIAAGIYEAVVLTNINTPATEITVPSCRQPVTLSETAPENPLFVIVKDSGLVCQANGNAVIDYVITITNISNVAGSIEFVEDQYDSRLFNAGITPTNINPGAISVSGGLIRWLGTSIEAGGSQTYTYRVTIPARLIPDFVGSPLLNQVVAQYDTPSSADNTISATNTENIICSVVSIPETALVGSNLVIPAIGILSLITAYFVYKYRIGNRQVRLVLSEGYYSSPIATFEQKVDKSARDRIKS